MKTVQERLVRTEPIWHSYLFLIIGGSSALLLNYVFMFTTFHEFLHSIPLILGGVPVITSSTFCMSSYILGLLRGVSWLSAVFPYLVGFIVTVAPVPYMVFRRKISLFWLEFVIVSFVLTLMCTVVHLWAEFLFIPL
ncbi:MAG: hypothetical protein WED07_13895 [Candidatus Freyarchaeum deiterrae]